MRRDWRWAPLSRRRASRRRPSAGRSGRSSAPAAAHSSVVKQQRTLAIGWVLPVTGAQKQHIHVHVGSQIPRVRRTLVVYVFVDAMTTNPFVFLQCCQVGPFTSSSRMLKETHTHQLTYFDMNTVLHYEKPSGVLNVEISNSERTA